MLFNFQHGQFGRRRVGGGGGGGGGGGSYHTANLVFMLDAGVSASYSGSGQTFANIVTSPSDGSAQTDYDFYRGNTSGSDTSDPTFNGTAGTDVCYFETGESPAELEYFTKVAANTVFLKGLHKTGAKYTIEVWLRPGTVFSGIRPAFDSGGSDQGGGYTSRSVSFADFSVDGAYKNSIRVTRDSGGAQSLGKVADYANMGGASTICMVACSIDATGTGNSFLYTNGAYDQVSGADTWDGTYSSPGSSDPANKAAIFASADLTTNIQGRLYLIRVYDTNLTKAQLDTNWNGNKDRFGAGGGPVLYFNSSANSGFSLANTDHVAGAGISNSNVIGLQNTGTTVKRYLEFKFTTLAAANTSAYFGLKSGSTTTFASPYSVWNANGTHFALGVSTLNLTSAIAVNDVGQICYDPVTGKVWVGKNNVYYNSGDPAAGTGYMTQFAAGQDVYFSFHRDNNSAGDIIMALPASAYAYAPPSGFSAL